MIPKIKKYDAPNFPEYKWIVIGKHGADLCKTFLRAFRYWLWHCGVPAKLAFLRFK